MTTFLVLIILGLIAALAFSILQRPPVMPPKDLDLVLPDIPPPTAGTSFVDVHVPRKVLAGDPIRVLITSDGKPAPGVQIDLADAFTDDVVLQDTTDANGVAVLTAPTVQDVTTYAVGVVQPGFAHYWPDTDMRTWEYTIGFYPEAGLTVWPAVVPTGVMATVKPKFWIDVGYGLYNPTVSFDELEAKAKAKGMDFDEDGWAGDGTLFDHVRELGQDDIWVFSGHSIHRKGDPTKTPYALAAWRSLWYLRGHSKVRIRDLCRHFGPNGAPGIVFLDSCKSSVFLDELIECCVRIAIGWSAAVPERASSAAMRNFFLKLLAGGTLREARDAANDKVNRSFARTNAQMVIKTKPWITSLESKTLAQLQSATSDDDFWYEYSWDDLSEGDKYRWGKLGWNEDNWDGNAPDPDTTETEWDDLTDEQRACLRELGYTEEVWNDE